MQRTKELEKDVSDRDEEIEKLSSKKVELEYNLSQRVHHINQIEKTLKDVRAEKVMLTCAGRLPSFLIVLGGVRCQWVLQLLLLQNLLHDHVLCRPSHSPYAPVRSQNLLFDPHVRHRKHAAHTPCTLPGKPSAQLI